VSLPALTGSGLLSFLDTFKFTEGYYSLKSILLTLSFCFLLRTKNIEGIHKEPPGELGRAIGLDRIPEVKLLRGKVAMLSAGGQAKTWLGKQSKQWMDNAPGLAGVLYVDGHENPYFGKNNKLPRKYMSRLRLALRGTTDYWVNDRLGQPFFSISKSINTGMINSLKEDIVPRLLNDVPQQPSGAQLAADRHLHRFMIVCDREIYSPGFMIDMWEKRVAVCTYNKYVTDKWDEGEFHAHTVYDENGKAETILLAERAVLIEGKESEKLKCPVPQIRFVATDRGMEVKVGKKYTRKKRQLWAREVRKLKPGGHQTSILCTNYKLPIATIGQYMFARWCQENFFKYMMEHFGIDSLVSYMKKEIDDTAELINPQWRQMDKKRRGLNRKLQKLQSKLAERMLEDDILGTKARDYNDKQSQLLEDINILKAESLEHKNDMAKVPKRVKFSELQEDEKFKAVYNERKQFVDTIKIIAYRAETALANTINKYMAKPAEARSLLRQVFQSTADLNVNYDKNTLEVSIHHLSTNRDSKALKKLCADLNETKTLFPDTNLTLVYKLVSD